MHEDLFMKKEKPNTTVFSFDLRNNPKETKYGSNTEAIKAMNQQQAVDYLP